jgi:3-deoxy-D-manno-octulosonic-acid transferase
VSALLACQAAVVVRDGHELQAFVERCLARPDEARQLGERAQQLVREQQGATQRTVELLEQLIGDKPAGRTARAA